MSYFAKHRQPPEEWVFYLDMWCAWLLARGCTEKTVEHWWYIASHLAIRSHKHPVDVRPEHIIEYLNRGVENAAKRSDYNALNSFFIFLTDRGLRVDNPMRQVPAVKRYKIKQKPAVERDVRRALEKSEPDVALMVAIINDLGLRRSEVASLHSQDLYTDANGAAHIIVHGKGHKDRILPLGEALEKRIGAFHPNGWFFPSPLNANRPVNSDTVYRKVKEATGHTPHALRRKFATDLWHATNDVVQVQEMLGHENLNTTQTYLYTTVSDLRNAMSKLEEYRRSYNVV
ncbi:hypothetical protein B9G54_04510 [Alloscardovia macacae]|uniref:Tyr recombinase domain-containing protein n=1 Tax=Alloscardovia macacae TaxID=1160091 RepID=A0A1Y2SW02_9BIFI|nr:tyrosine-type recombinase/integrase [Alloscardovia macacae]OTA26457.1 hypothetical protein B9G54_04510 [Alloscardovia macacae]OTA29863.1 hypothetical protein B9T39_01935 [Alloscardovia macacae]